MANIRALPFVALLLAAPAAAQPAAPRLQTAVFAGGCFWGVQGVFQHVKGVVDALAGYDGGSRAQAHYEIVSTGTTGNAEAVRVVFDPAQISYAKILEIYFLIAAEPTQAGGQGPDQGSQYRSEIFYETPAQKEEAGAMIAALAARKVFRRPIVTTLAPDTGFWRAEAYHQNYLIRHPTSLYIESFDDPKLRRLEKAFPDLWRAKPVFAS
ncbi:MAG: peptide-methionine (S)-S-oxide reductase MsrA [Caulobacteraceae bacterium]